MATKKQKREKALAKRDAFLNEERQRGLDALRREKEAREIRERQTRNRIRDIDNQSRLVELIGGLGAALALEERGEVSSQELTERMSHIVDKYAPVS